MREDEHELIIKIPSQSPHAHITLVGEDGSHKQKDVSIEDLISHLAQNHQFSTGLLPQGTRLYKGTGANYTIAIEMPAKIRPLRYQRVNDRDRRTNEAAQIPFPICIFVFKVGSNAIRRSDLYCARNAMQRVEDVLCYFPFGNVYSEGNICWGNTGLPTVSAPMGLVSVINTFFDSVYNGDLFDRANIRTTDEIFGDGGRIASFHALVRYLDGKPEFPTEMLRSNSRTLYRVTGND